MIERTQAEAVAIALQVVRAGGVGGVVHVYGGKDEVEGDYARGEVVCGPPFGPEEQGDRVKDPTPTLVLYHPEVANLAGGGWACAVCGREGGRTAPRPLRRS